MVTHLDQLHFGPWRCVVWMISALSNSADGLRATLPHDSITDKCLKYPEEATSIVHKAELDLLKRDKSLTLTEASKHQSLKHILNIKCWLRVWDKALDRGCAGTIAIQKLIQYLATPVFIDRCQYCTRSINPDVTCAEHGVLLYLPCSYFNALMLISIYYI